MVIFLALNDAWRLFMDLFKFTHRYFIGIGGGGVNNGSFNGIHFFAWLLLAILHKDSSGWDVH